jgi:hypothetical protein
MNQEQKKAFDAVQKINDELLKFWDEKDVSLTPQLSITFCNDMMFISLHIPSGDNIILPELDIYNSIVDDRIFYGEKNEYESYYAFIKRKFNEIKEGIY